MRATRTLDAFRLDPYRVIDARAPLIALITQRMGIKRSREVLERQVSWVMNSPRAGSRGRRRTSPGRRAARPRACPRRGGLT
jgi:hypothetical protein